MGFLDKAKAAAEQTAAKAKGEYEELQLKRELGQAYDALGKTAFELIESGELTHEQLEEPVAKIRALRERAAGDDGSADDATGGEAAPDPPEPTAPPTT